MLTLPIKRKWFDMIMSGEKLEEYRDLTDYYHSRLARYVGETIDIILKAGYSRGVPSAKCKVFVGIGAGSKEWGAEPWEDYYVLKILSKELLTDQLQK